MRVADRGIECECAMTPLQIELETARHGGSFGQGRFKGGVGRRGVPGAAAPRSPFPRSASHYSWQEREPEKLDRRSANCQLGGHCGCGPSLGFPLPLSATPARRRRTTSSRGERRGTLRRAAPRLFPQPFEQVTDALLDSVNGIRHRCGRSGINSLPLRALG